MDMNATGKIDIKALTLPELKAEMELIGEKPFRAGQIYRWLHQKNNGISSFSQMTDGPTMVLMSFSRSHSPIC